jgi:hypothetical protein
MNQTDLVISTFAELIIFIFAIIGVACVLYFIVSWLLSRTDNNSQISDILERQSEHDTWTHMTIEPIDEN